VLAVPGLSLADDCMVASWFAAMNSFAHAFPFLDDPCFAVGL
jgi:hypothetical protein